MHVERRDRGALQPPLRARPTTAGSETYRRRRRRRVDGRRRGGGLGWSHRRTVPVGERIFMRRTGVFGRRDSIIGRCCPGESSNEARPEDGEGHSMKCARCDSDVPLEAKFCPECGMQPRQRWPLRLAAELHPEASRREDPERTPFGGRREEADQRDVRRRERLDGAARRPRSGRSARPARPGARADDGGRASLRGHRQPGDGRRHHGALRRAARARGPRRARLLRGAAHPGDARPAGPLGPSPPTRDSRRCACASA